MRNTLVIGSIALIVLAAGCARRPVLTGGAAAPPGGAAVSRAGAGAEPARPGGAAAAEQRTAGGAQQSSEGRGQVTAAPPSSGTAPGTPSAPRGATPETASRPATAAPDMRAAEGRAAATRPAPGQFTALAELADIHFDFDKHDIRPGDAKILEANAEWLRRNPESLLLIEGHCDERGTNDYNVALGERRAKATMNYLVAQGVAAARMTTVSYGEERPVCTARNESCWAKNRRAHFLVKRG